MPISIKTGREKKAPLRIHSHENETFAKLKSTVASLQDVHGDRSPTEINWEAAKAEAMNPTVQTKVINFNDIPRVTFWLYSNGYTTARY